MHHVFVFIRGTHSLLVHKNECTLIQIRMRLQKARRIVRSESRKENYRIIRLVKRCDAFLWSSRDLYPQPKYCYERLSSSAILHLNHIYHIYCQQQHIFVSSQFSSLFYVTKILPYFLNYWKKCFTRNFLC